MSNEAETFREWALVELMGHQRICGLVSEQQIAGAGMIRVDVPECDGQPGFSRLFSPSAIYSINPISEPLARSMVARCGGEPVRRYELPALPASPRPVGDAGLFGGEDDEG